MSNDVHLITYADRFGGGGIDRIGELLTGPLEGAFTGVHLLPFYTPFDGADAGFDPSDHTEVDPRLGDWSSIGRLASTHEVMADLIVNHVSVASPQFRDFLERGDDSAFAGMFLEFDRAFPEADDTALAQIYRPRPGLPFTEIAFADGSVRKMWTTFTSQQIDIDTSHPQGRAYLWEVLDRMAAAGVRLVRLDAIGYAVKTPGTSCFMTEDTYRFIEEVGDQVRQRGMDSLLEIHSHFEDQLAIASKADRVYDFALPPLVLHALYTGTAEVIARWLAVAPRNAVTVLDTHDGIGVIDVGPDDARPGLLDASQVDELVEGIHEASAGQSRLATGAAASNLDLYQVNCTYYSALGEDDDQYLLARLLQLLAPGTPQVYYAGLLAAPNDLDLLGTTGVGRDINRPYFTVREIEASLERSVVQHLLAMCRFRRTHPAFLGEFSSSAEGSTLSLIWHAAGAAIDASIDVAEVTFELRHTIGDESSTWTSWDEFADTG